MICWWIVHADLEKDRRHIANRNVLFTSLRYTYVRMFIVTFFCFCFFKYESDQVTTPSFGMIQKISFLRVTTVSIFFFCLPPFFFAPTSFFVFARSSSSASSFSSLQVWGREKDPKTTFESFKTTARNVHGSHIVNELFLFFFSSSLLLDHRFLLLLLLLRFFLHNKIFSFTNRISFHGIYVQLFVDHVLFLPLFFLA